MSTTKREPSTGRAFAVPLAVILGLLAVHWVISDWSALPRLISSTLGSTHEAPIKPAIIARHESDARRHGPGPYQTTSLLTHGCPLTPP